MKKYMDIQRIKPAIIDGFQVGDHIVVQEKIDGANFSIKYDAETDSIKAFSRKQELNECNTLRGAWNFAQSLDKEEVAKMLGDELILFGEWLVKHSVSYPEDKYNKAYFYDIFDTRVGQYAPQGVVKKIVKRLGLNYVPVFYEGAFTSWDDLMPLVGKTEMGGEYGEGIVVKNQRRLDDSDSRLPFYLKIVAEKFCETKAHKERRPVDPALIAERAARLALIQSVVTPARVIKILHKFVDEGILREDWDETDMRTIAQNMGKAVYADCVKEEPETVERVGHEFGKFANSEAMKIVKGVLAERLEV